MTIPRRRADLSAFRIVACALALLCAGCARWQNVGLIDQRTFDPQAGVAPRPRVPPPPPARPGPYSGPLISITAGTAQAQWEPPLHQAVQAALARKPNVLFELRQSVPSGGDVDAAAAAAQRAAAALLEPVAKAIVADGASIAQVEVGAALQPLPSGSGGAVQVFLH